MKSLTVDHGAWWCSLEENLAADDGRREVCLELVLRISGMIPRVVLNAVVHSSSIDLVVADMTEHPGDFITSSGSSYGSVVEDYVVRSVIEAASSRLKCMRAGVSLNIIRIGATVDTAEAISRRAGDLLASVAVELAGLNDDRLQAIFDERIGVWASW